MEYIEDYDEQAQSLVKKIDQLFRQTRDPDSTDAQKQGLLGSITRGIKELREVCQLFKSDLYLIPRNREQEYKQKYQAFIKRLGDYDRNAKILECQVNRDEKGIKDLKKSFDTTQKLNAPTQALAKKGFETQDKSKEALNRIRAKVGETIDLANENKAQLQEQSVQMLRINDQV